MPFTVKVVVKNRRGPEDARLLARIQANAAAAYLRESLINGYRPADGEARPRKPDGKPLGFDTGHLARGIKAAPAYQTRNRARVKITAPASRRPFLVKQPDVLTLNGLVRDEMNFALREHREKQ